MASPRQVETATFGTGCFLAAEATFRAVDGVLNVEPGFAGGQSTNIDYKRVSRGGTGHAEVVQIEFDPDITSFEQLLEVFFQTHDPCKRHRPSSPCRSIILYHTQAQKASAIKACAIAEKTSSRPIATDIVLFNVSKSRVPGTFSCLTCAVLSEQHFVIAEDHFRNYYAKKSSSSPSTSR